MMFAISLALVLRLPNITLQRQVMGKMPPIGISRVYRIALPALTLPLVFGFMESGLNGDLPLFAERIHMPLGVVSASLAAFVIGSLVFQLPLGHLSDRWGRRAVLTGCSIVGVVLFTVLPIASGSSIMFVCLSCIVGAFLGTLFSLSLGYLGDLVGAADLPIANQLAVTNLGLGLMFGPTIGGLIMTWLGPPRERASILSMLGPVITILLGTLFLGERLEMTQWVGCLIVILAIAALELQKIQKNVEVFYIRHARQIKHIRR
jgi:MFS family permease